MMHEVRSIPPAPRHVRAAPLFAHRWPLLAVGGALCVVGGLIAWLMFLQAGGIVSRSTMLDQGPTTRVEGHVRRVSETREFDGRQWREIGYHFSFQSITLHGLCFVPERAMAPGDEVLIDVLVADANINRIVSGILNLDRQWLRARFWILLLVTPGGFMLFGWLAGMFQLRQVLVHGDVSVGHVLQIRRVPLVLPEMLQVSYEFRDHRAIVRRSRHWVRSHGPLGARLLAQLDRNKLEPMPVLHDRRLPQWSRMLLPPDFLPVPSTAMPPVSGLS